MITRRLAAILAADVVGFSRLVGADDPAQPAGFVVDGRQDGVCPFTGTGNWSQLMAGSGGSQGLPSIASRMASSAVMP